MQVAVTGITGRVGAALASHLAAGHQVVPLPRTAFDLADRDAMLRVLEQLDCEVLVHPAGITGLEACEDDPALAMRVNAEAAGEMASWAATRGVRMVYFSTDYVFGGRTPGLRCEGDETEPLSVYGRSKLTGEQAVLGHRGHSVIRVSWVFGPEKRSFIDQIFDDALAGRPLAAVADKLSLPTFTTDLAEWVELLISQQATGVFHACNSGEPTSWHGMAREVVEMMAACGTLDAIPEISQVKLAEVAAFRAVRPRFTAMDTARLNGCLGRAPRRWMDALGSYVRDRCKSL